MKMIGTARQRREAGPRARHAAHLSDPLDADHSRRSSTIDMYASSSRRRGTTGFDGDAGVDQRGDDIGTADSVEVDDTSRLGRDDGDERRSTRVEHVSARARFVDFELDRCVDDRRSRRRCPTRPACRGR